MWDTSQFPFLPEALETQVSFWGAVFIKPVRCGCFTPLPLPSRLFEALLCMEDLLGWTEGMGLSMALSPSWAWLALEQAKSQGPKVCWCLLSNACCK